MFDAVKALVGAFPTGYDYLLNPVIYVLCIPLLMWLLGQFFGILWSLMEGLFHVR